MNELPLLSPVAPLPPPATLKLAGSRNTSLPPSLSQTTTTPYTPPKNPTSCLFRRRLNIVPRTTPKPLVLRSRSRETFGSGPDSSASRSSGEKITTATKSGIGRVLLRSRFVVIQKEKNMIDTCARKEKQLMSCKLCSKFTNIFSIRFVPPVYPHN